MGKWGERESRAETKQTGQIEVYSENLERLKDTRFWSFGKGDQK